MYRIKKHIRKKRLRNLIERQKYLNKLKALDRFYENYCGCFMLFPPSFYHIHSPEEIQQLTKEKMKRISELIDELE